MITTIDEPTTAAVAGKDEARALRRELAPDPLDRASDQPAAGEESPAAPVDQTVARLLYELAVRLPMLADAEALCVRLCHPDRTVELHLRTANSPASMELPLDESITRWVCQHQRPLVVNPQAEPRFPEFARWLQARGITSFCAIPLMIANRKRGILGLASTNPKAFHHLKLKCEGRGRKTGGLNVGRAPLEPCADIAREAEESFEGIIGRSEAMCAVREEIQIVAPTSSTVLILGETGTGKELIARAIHNLGPRRDRPFIKVNCAAIPSGLLESELFGHERGAFTGALGRRIGRFEMAHGGTLFLDEVGDLPLELQPKLLRVLQEQEFERLGSTQTTKVDVRVVAATSRDLPRMVTAKEFRGDLFYRLNVFPLRVPALRDRAEDIVPLTRHFVEFYAQRMGKLVTEVPAEAVEALMGYGWPGNVRELQNFIERAVILSPGRGLRAPLYELESNDSHGPAGSAAGNKATTLRDAEREHILQALAATNWVLGGPRGAGARLGLARTTLIGKMQRLGISRARV